jgi:hypothetical protein
MAKRRYTAEEIVTVLRQVEVAVANGQRIAQACRESGIAEQGRACAHSLRQRTGVCCPEIAKVVSAVGYPAALNRTGQPLGKWLLRVVQ